MENTTNCKECAIPMKYEVIEAPVMGADLSFYAPSICDECYLKFQEEQAKKVNLSIYRTISLCMPEAYRGVKMSDFEDVLLNNAALEARRAEDVIKSFCNSPYWCITIASPETGIGKTRLGLYILSCLALKGHWKTREITCLQDAGYFSALEIVKILKTETFDSAQWWLKKFKKSRVLMIDDLGQERLQESFELANIIKYREENKLKTIITTNSTKKQFDGRIWSRLKKGMHFMAGTDRR